MSGARLALWLVLASVWPTGAGATTITETFGTDPGARGWRAFGQTNLFVWNAAAQNLSVTWDSSQTNSYFFVPLGTILNRFDDFSVALDLNLTNATGGINPNKSSTFELAAGFLNLNDAAQPTFFRGNSHTCPDLVEFDYFPDTGFGPTIWPAIYSTNSVLSYNGPSDYTLLDLPLGITMRISMSYTASNSTLVTLITTNGVSIGAIHNVKLASTFTNDFRVGGFAIESYSDAGQDPRYGGSLLAHGTVDNVQLNVPPPPVQAIRGSFTNGHWQAIFTSRTNWMYTLERATNFIGWNNVSSPAPGNGATMALQDTNAPGARGFYRVRAERWP